MIQKGKKVAVEYTVFLEDGMQIDTNVGDDPLVFTIGQQQVFPALELALIDLSVGDTKEVFLQAEEAYGPIVSEAFKEVDLSSIPEQFRYSGAILGIQDPAGGVYPIRVHEVKNQKAVLDFNHPLAGKNLRFMIKVLNVA